MPAHPGEGAVRDLGDPASPASRPRLTVRCWPQRRVSAQPCQRTAMEASATPGSGFMTAPAEPKLPTRPSPAPVPNRRHGHSPGGRARQANADMAGTGLGRNATAASWLLGRIPCAGSLHRPEGDPAQIPVARDTLGVLPRRRSCAERTRDPAESHQKTTVPSRDGSTHAHSADSARNRLRSSIRAIHNPFVVPPYSS